MVPSLTKSECERPRTQAELRAWVDLIHSQFGATAAGKTAFRLARAFLVKEFKEEIWPLARVADAFYEGRTDLLFVPAIGNQSYDARILDANTGNVLEYIQTVQSIEGEQEHLRMRQVEDHGHAPLTGAQLPRTPKNHPIPETWGDAVEHDEAREQTLARILASVQGKSQMSYERGTSLIVEIDDLHIQSQADREVLREFARARLMPLVKRFDKLYLVSDSGAIAFCFEVAAV